MNGRQTSTWIAVVVFISLFGLSILYAIQHRGASGLAVPKPLATPERDGDQRIVETDDSVDAGIGGQYVSAMQDNDCEELIRLTWWMNERLRYAAEQGDDLDEVHAELCEQVVSRKIEEAQLTAEGVRDKYIFTPSAEITPLGRDEGLDTLAKPADHRIWFHVKYPNANRALLSEEGKPIAELRVGLNISEDGHVLKADVLGTAELDRSSFIYATDSEGGN